MKYVNPFKLFECGRNILDRLDVSYERACIVIQSTISDSAYYDSEEQVDDIRASNKRVDAISNFNKLVDTVSETKLYRY